MAGLDWLPVATEPQAGQRAKGDRANLSDRAAAEQDHQCRDRRDRGPLAVGAERPRHSPHRLRDDRHGNELEPMKQARTNCAVKISGAVGEQDEQDGRRQGKAGPGRCAAEIAGAHKTDRKTNLTGRRAGQKLTKRHQVGIGLFVEPAPARDELITEVTDMGDRSAEATQPEFEENEQNFDGRTRPLSDNHRKPNLFCDRSR